MKKILLILVLALLVLPALSYEEFDPAKELEKVKELENEAPRSYRVITSNSRDGYYIDGRGQVREEMRIAPPNEQYIPSRPIRSVEPFDMYYNVNHLGMRRDPRYEPIIPGYNAHFSNRRVYPYDIDDYIKVWCTGDIDYDKNLCSTKEYNIYFTRARNWSASMAALPFKALKNKGKRVALFLVVDEIGLDSEYVSDAKAFAALVDLQLFAGTIDAYLPLAYFI